jgi:uncharacterized protein
MTRILDNLARTLVVIGALNWGLVAVARYDLVAEIFGLTFGDTNAGTRTVYGLVGLAAVWMVLRMFAPARMMDREIPSTEIRSRRAA